MTLQKFVHNHSKWCNPSKGENKSKNIELCKRLTLPLFTTYCIIFFSCLSDFLETSAFQMEVKYIRNRRNRQENNNNNSINKKKSNENPKTTDSNNTISEF